LHAADRPERVHVSGARGRAPTDSYKVSATYLDGFKTSAQLTIVGFDAAAKARRTGEAILQRVGELLAAQGLPPFSATHLEVLGAESCYGPLAQPEVAQTREAILRLAARHRDKAALELLAREIARRHLVRARHHRRRRARLGLAADPAIRLPAGQGARDARHHAGWRPSLAPSPSGRGQGEGTRPATENANHEQNEHVASIHSAQTATNSIANPADTLEVPLIRLAWARSGDKGDTSNIGVIARRPEWLPLLRAQLTEARVAEHLAHLVKGPVTRHEVPGIHAFNFVCEQALGGGGMASLRNDPLGKGMGQILLAMPVRVPKAWSL
jgi:hypothetical protein